jgi:hypothetical protein
MFAEVLRATCTLDPAGVLNLGILIGSGTKSYPQLSSKSTG